VLAVRVKMPAPMTTATPKTVRSQAVRSLRSLVSGSSVSAIDCSIDLVRHNPFPGTVDTSLMDLFGPP
jgi:hypothetical protein